MTDPSGYCYPHPRPALTSDIVLLRETAGRPLQVLLIRRGHPPFEGKWALPGGFVEEGESPEVGAQRELAEETGVTGVDLRQVGAFGEPGRDPRGWTVSVAFVARGPLADAIKAGDDAADVRWWPVDALPPLAFDHPEIIRRALASAA